MQWDHFLFMSQVQETFGSRSYNNKKLLSIINKIEMFINVIKKSLHVVCCIPVGETFILFLIVSKSNNLNIQTYSTDYLMLLWYYIRSGKDGLYPELIEFTEKRLEQVNPKRLVTYIKIPRDSMTLWQTNWILTKIIIIWKADC